MLERFSRSWTLAKASVAVLMDDQALLLFPLASIGALLVIVASFALPAFGLAMTGAFNVGASGSPSAAAWALGFMFYFAHYFVVIYFNVALVGAAMIRLQGGTPTFREGLAIASARVGAIAGYALIAATVGILLRALQGRVGFVGRIIVGLLGVAWTVATFLVIPIVATRDVGPVDAVKESAALIKQTWGENVIGQAGLGLVFSFVYFVVVVVGVLLVFGGLASGSVAVAIAAFAIVILLAGVAALAHAALNGIYSAALYRYATTGKSGLEFGAGDMQLAFAPK